MPALKRFFGAGILLPQYNNLGYKEELTMSIYLHDTRKININEETIPEIDYDSLMTIQEMGITLDTENLDEAFLDPPESVKKAIGKVESLIDLKNQWKKVADSFTMHKWIDRYIKDEKQEEMLKKYFDILCADDVKYGEYKRAFKFIANFFGLPNNAIIIENLNFTKDKVDKGQKKVALRYSRGLARVNIPSNFDLIHVSPANNITALEPSFRSKVKGRFMYPSKRCFFTIANQIKKNQAGLEGQKLTKYVTKQHYSTAYIDPTYAMFKDRSVYIETEQPIPVEKVGK